MMKKNECCGTCRWHEHEDIDDGWVCVNPESEYCTDWTDYEHNCLDWEPRKERINPSKDNRKTRQTEK